ncbi:MAG: acetyl-coenzyme A synthetase N-terminal domain-containing protein [Brevundimonas sp.]|nr:acetyl-coenzyme A synthetase N-terminal domain-containing protein [Brevundimonas sp.]MDI1325610.1 acetyl-coenzyme A synthetase N-terminal domain-containing protein [Brevundimonas sp.]
MSTQADPNLYPVPSEWAQRARMNHASWEAARTSARETPDAFWREQARRLEWVTAPTRIKDVSFDKADFRIRWFEDGVLNVAWNCLDRHLAEHAGGPGGGGGTGAEPGGGLNRVHHACDSSPNQITDRE